ncbi:hypothetical protein BDQ12DRAFT_262423 [Crucibulum laeve]|uniref:Uncharacterized protein n=1 Tax=Crucibulum laeve TaxID=68775 RepID=A0A5C3LVM5_9AGAR|nr:hypothetical protein BDQ12DRAFT_262423 [Crucibulum laeve]
MHPGVFYLLSLTDFGSSADAFLITGSPHHPPVLHLHSTFATTQSWSTAALTRTKMWTTMDSEFRYFFPIPALSFHQTTNTVALNASDCTASMLLPYLGLPALYIHPEAQPSPAVPSCLPSALQAPITMTDLVRIWLVAW